MNQLLNVTHLKAHWYERTVEPMIHHNLNLGAGHEGPPYGLPLWMLQITALSL